MVPERLFNIYRRFRLLSYRSLFRHVREKEAALSTSEAFTADVINLLEEPTVSQFAGYIGISQPNASYKVNSLMAKGYVEKVSSKKDRRECRLHMGKMFRRYYTDSNEKLEAALQKLSRRFSSDELSTTAKVLDVLICELENEEDNVNGSVSKML